MRLKGNDQLIKHSKKNKGNVPLRKRLEKLRELIKTSYYRNYFEMEAGLMQFRPDKVYEDTVCFIDLTNNNRILAQIDYSSLTDEDLKGIDSLDEDYLYENEGEIFILWVNDHDSYEKTFNNSKKDVQKWLKSHDYI